MSMNTGSIRPRIGLLASLAAVFGFGAKPAIGAMAAKPAPIFSHVFPAKPHEFFFGHSPADYGMSRECAKQRRKNKLRRLGIGGDRQ